MFFGHRILKSFFVKRFLMKKINYFFSHGGDTAAIFAKNHLMNFIVDQPGFWSNDDEGKEGRLHKNLLKIIRGVCHANMLY